MEASGRRVESSQERADVTHHNRKLTAPKPPAQRKADTPIPASVSRKEMRAKSGFETESYAYDFRARNNLKQNRDA